MKITIEQLEPGGQEEIIIRCTEVDSELLRLVTAVKNRRSRLTAYSGDGIVKLSPEEIFYFESVDNKTFLYTEKSVYRCDNKLYELESMLGDTSFVRISKSCILNSSAVESVRAEFSGRLEAKLKNGEKVLVSKHYLGAFRAKFCSN